MGLYEPISGFKVAPLTANDLPAVFALDAEALGVDAWKHEWFGEGLTDENARYALVYDGDLLVAFCGCYFWENEKSYCKVMTLAVREGYRRRGIARELLTRFIDEARLKGLKSVVLETSEGNANGQALYGGLGFRLEEVRPNYYNDGKAGLVMRKHLTNEAAPPISVVVRPAVVADAPALAGILCAAWRAAFGDILSADEMAANTDVADKTAMFEYVLSENAAHVRLAEVDGEPCGLVMYGARRDGGFADHGEIISLHALKNFWGAGVGGRLLKAALWDLDRLGYKKAAVWTFESNARARRFYEKNGFVTDGKTKDSAFGGAREALYALDL